MSEWTANEVFLEARFGIFSATSESFEWDVYVPTVPECECAMSELFYICSTHRMNTRNTLTLYHLCYDFFIVLLQIYWNSDRPSEIPVSLCFDWWLDWERKVSHVVDGRQEMLNPIKTFFNYLQKNANSSNIFKYVKCQFQPRPHSNLAYLLGQQMI